ncbi:MAG: hypothetical protein PHI90_01565 [Clostridia bacterium]|nr:hypothetical protein [Clostridia bacterium]MDD4047513.1 hypothetical protein [Clostridia bacterium]
MYKKFVEKAINGDEESFRWLVQQRKKSIYRIAFNYVKLGNRIRIPKNLL